MMMEGKKVLSPIVQKEEAGYSSKHQDYCHIKLELLVFVFVGKPMGINGGQQDDEVLTTNKIQSLNLSFHDVLKAEYFTYFAWLLRSVTFTLPRTKFRYSLKTKNTKKKI